MLQHALPVPLGVLEKIEHVYGEHQDYPHHRGQP